jgi:transcriptional regulator with XRE-family HTH domain
MAERAMEPISTALAELLVERGMNQTDLWAAADLSSSTVSLYLSGKRGMTAIDHRGAATIEKLAAVFGLDPSYFLEYRMWQMREIARKYPTLADRGYELLISLARSVGDSVSSRSRGT